MQRLSLKESDAEDRERVVVLFKYWIHNPLHYDYIVNNECAVQLAPIHYPVLRTRAERDGMESCTAALRRMMKSYRTPGAAQRLEKFADVMDLDGEALLKASTDGPEPAQYKTLDTP
ncbi:hypothetical protein AcV5_000761 [Taiwanofungus camphoratus]|nr:hypothetical protein AcV5_000761 [Antrodia cinnamomea]